MSQVDEILGKIQMIFTEDVSNKKINGTVVGLREAKEELKSLLLSEAVVYELYVKSDDNNVELSMVQAIPIEAINKIFGESE